MCGLQRALSTLLPIFFVLTAASHAYAQYSVTASWDRNTDANTKGYRLYYGTSSGSYQWSVDAGSQTSAPLNLSSGRYYFAVRAYNSSSQYGPQSAEATVTVGSSVTGSPTAKINASLDSASTAFVTWTTTNATSATLNGSAVPVNGSVKLPISGTTTYTIVAKNSSGQTATANVTLGGGGSSATPAPTAKINGSLDSASTAFVTWATTNATSATLNGKSIPVNGSTKVPISGATTFTIVAKNSAGQTATANVTVGGSGSTSTTAPTAKINGSLDSSTTAFVTWTTTNATSATLNGKSIPVNGSTKLPISGATTYTIVAKNNAGQTATASVTVGGSGTGSTTAPTAKINASLDSATTAFVTWSSTNATRVTINGNAAGLTGSAKVPISGTTTYTIVATNSAGQTATSSATVVLQTGQGPTAWIGASLDSSNTAFVAWSSSNGTYVTINGGEVPPSGSVKTPIYVTTSYTIVVKDSAGRTATSKATVYVP